MLNNATEDKTKRRRVRQEFYAPGREPGSRTANRGKKWKRHQRIKFFPTEALVPTYRVFDSDVIITDNKNVVHVRIKWLLVEGRGHRDMAISPVEQQTSTSYGPALQKMLKAFPGLHEKGNGWWAHDDNPTFDCRELENGSIVLHSWTGRSDQEILAMGGLGLGRLC